MAENSINPRELTRHLWLEVAEENRAVDADMPILVPPVHIRHDETLGSLNRSYVFPVPDPDAQGGGGWLRGRVRSLAARLILSLMGGYFVEERKFLEQLIRFQNELAKRNDETLEEIRSVDRGVRACVAGLAARDDLLHARAEARIKDLEQIIEGGSSS